MTSPSDPKPFVYTRRVGYVDTDQMGVVHHSVYVVYFEEARLAYLREAGLPYRELEERGVLLPVVELRVRYRRPARLEDLLAIHVQVADIHRHAFTLTYRIFRDGVLLVEGWTKLAAMNREGRLIRLPEDLLAVLSPAPDGQSPNPG